jgi:putative membrane protein insertion efficiency factor
MRVFFVRLIALYQRWLSPALGTRCRFHPSCSHYAVTALERFGSLRGGVLASARILRCHPLNRGGFDAVPTQFPRRFWRRNPDRAPPLPANADTGTPQGDLR